MYKSLFYFFFLFFFFNTYSQNLVYKSNGEVYNSKNKKLAPSEVRNIVSVNTIVLDLYNQGRDKKSIGNALLIGGFLCIAGDLAIGLNSDTKYPSALSFIGIGAIVFSIPVKIGYSKRIKKAVDEYNKFYPDGNTSTLSNKSLEFVANANGLGFRLSLN